MIAYESLYREYETGLADAVLPGDDYFARERRAARSEMLVGMLCNGAELTLYTVGDRLSMFAPQSISEEHWTEQTRPEIFNALAEHFIERGHEKRSQMQQKLLDTLERSGVRIEGREVLDAAPPWSG